MKNYNYLIFLFCWCLYLFFNENEVACSPYKQETLELVSVLFRHGNRTPNGPEEIYPRDPYKEERYEGIGVGQLTNAGKRREYRIGKDLRDLYDKFLGPYCSTELIEPTSTDYNRTKASLLLVLASCCRPRGVQIWKDNLNWQPIPYNYLPRSQDKVLLGSLCPYYLKLYNAYVQSPKNQAELNKYKDLFNYISKNSGLNVTKFQDIYNLFFGLKAEEDWGFQLEPWTKKVWPQNITELTIKEYFVGTATTELRRMASGYFLQKLENDINLKINGSTPERKMYLYSAHEDNIAKLLITLGLFKPPHVPDYGAYLIFELHNIRGTYGIKIFYQNYVTERPRLLKLPACETFCEINKFTALIEEYIPTSDNMCYWE